MPTQAKKPITLMSAPASAIQKVSVAPVSASGSPLAKPSRSTTSTGRSP
jgi:hypothetical protein